MKKRCTGCGEVKSLTNFTKNKSGKDGHTSRCRTCKNNYDKKYRSTEIGYLGARYNGIKERGVRDRKWGQKRKCNFTLQELRTAFTKHKSIHGMKSAWGPGIHNLEKHLPMTMITQGKGQIGKHGTLEGSKRTDSNLSIDRLDPDLDYTIQNIIFIRNDENTRKKDTSYKDCKIQIRLHEERF